MRTPDAKEPRNSPVETRPFRKLLWGVVAALLLLLGLWILNGWVRHPS